jgi:hypothetical protein
MPKGLITLVSGKQIFQICGCTSALLHTCTDALLHGCTAAWMHCCMDALLHGCTAAWMHCCTDALLHGCTAAWMHCCTDALGIALQTFLSFCNIEFFFFQFLCIWVWQKNCQFSVNFSLLVGFEPSTFIL